MRLGLPASLGARIDDEVESGEQPRGAVDVAEGGHDLEGAVRRAVVRDDELVLGSELGEDRRFRPIVVGDADLAVAEYAVCLTERRRVALVRAFMEEAAHPLMRSPAGS